MTAEQNDSTANDSLIAKKDVLELMGISYGQFYRWKRKGLIPESWFMRKSTFTGQETFLPRGLVLDRIEAIKALKDDHSLEEIAELLSPEPAKRTFRGDELRQQGWVRPATLDRYRALTGEAGPYRFRDLVLMELIDALEQDYGLERTSVDRMVATVWHSRIDVGTEGADWTVCLLETRGGERLGCLSPGGEIHVEPMATVRTRIAMGTVLERTRRRLSQRWEAR